jgi:hypothetical protein
MADPTKISKEQQTASSAAGSDKVKAVTEKVQAPPKKIPETVTAPANDRTIGQKINETEGQQTEKLYDISSLTKDLTPKKAMKLLGILIILIMIVLAVYVRFIRKTPVRYIPTLVNIPTPTYSPFQKYKPSIYAEDPNFKKIDEGFGVLENETRNITIEEKELLPRKLDFDVVFR